MGYQALLFCPDEKTARTVTQVLSELEFYVEACTEPFAAVKKLMGEHFDAIVVDGENEQNATLLFKSARNSASNQTSLAVSLVEGQAGVAKAFRIGANLVLTKPINVEQAKGTLRVARGLLRKGEPGKAAAPVSPPSVTQDSIVAATPAVPARTAPQTSAPATTPRPNLAAWPAKPFSSPFTAPTGAAPAMAASSMPYSDDDDNVIDVDEPAVATTANRNTTVASKPEAQSVPSAPSAAIKTHPSSSNLSSSTVSSASASGTGASSAAAPARLPQRFGEGTPPNVVGPTEALFEKSSSSVKVESAPFAAPSFSFGGANAPEEPPAGGSKRALIGVAAVSLIAVILYVGWTQFHGKTSSTEESPKTSETALPSTVTPPANTATVKVPSATVSSRPAPEIASPSASPPSKPTSEPIPHKPTEMPVSNGSQHSSDKAAAAKVTAKPSASISTHTSKSSTDAEPTVRSSSSQPIIVKNGSASPVRPSSAASDSAAPSVVGIAPSTSGGSLSNLLGNPNPQNTPVLETLNVSQGVSQGLLIKKVQPNYPSAAMRMHVEGSVQLMATIGKTGNITAVKLLSGEPILAQAALEAVKQWKYKPYYLNGEPVEIQTQVTVNFKLPR